MIQIKRGTKKNWLSLAKPLAAGQPGYEKDKHKIKVGTGEDLWSALPYASGLFAEEILLAESEAKKRHNLDKDDTTLITYGTAAPDKDTIGQMYLQYYDTEPEVDYIVSYGVNKGWTYQKWKSGIARCFITFEFNTSIQSAIEGSSLYLSNSTMKSRDYPFTFVSIPSETATVQSKSGLVWLVANKGLNTKSKSASYSLVSTDNLTNTATYHITFSVEGQWR